MNSVFFLALRNLYLQRKRYFLMGIAVALGFSLITILTALSNGALLTVKEKAARYYSGDITVYGLDSMTFDIKNPDEIISAVNYSPHAAKSVSTLPVKTASPRTVYYGKETRLFFGGKYIRILRPIGVDFDKEYEALREFPVSEGGIDGMLGTDGKKGILISRISARLLGAKVGDDVILNLVTTGGKQNTAVLVVKGIFEETGIFGYSAYVDRGLLNSLIQKDENWASEIALYIREGLNSARISSLVHEILSDRYDMLPEIESRRDFSRKRSDNRGNTNPVYAVISVDGQLDQLKDMLDAFLIVTYFVLIVFLLIVMAGILNTYRVLVYERTREIGTMRAIGMQSDDVKKLFLYEASSLSVISSAAGLVLGSFILFIISEYADLKNVPAADMFTVFGKLHFYLDFKTVLLNTAFMTGAVLAAAWGPAKKASSMPPAEALRKD